VSRGEKAIWCLVAFAILYFGGHIIAAQVRMADRHALTVTTTTVEQWPGCRAACHSTAAWRAVQDASAQAGPGFVCWAEDNREQVSGFEVICRRQ